jgi:hypothetical protein
MKWSHAIPVQFPRKEKEKFVHSSKLLSMKIKDKKRKLLKAKLGNEVE